MTCRSELFQTVLVMTSSALKPTQVQIQTSKAVSALVFRAFSQKLALRIIEQRSARSSFMKSLTFTALTKKKQSQFRKLRFVSLRVNRHQISVNGVTGLWSRLARFVQ